jgi:DNA topoisomerase-3
MSKVLVLAEKPSVGRDIARVLGCAKKGNGYMEGNKFVVTWALGHLVELAEPEAYDRRYASWRLEDLPIIPQQQKLQVIKQSGRQYKVVKEQMCRKDVREIVIATDAGREGELVARWIIAQARVKKPLKRLWISSVTDKAIRDGMNNLKDGRHYENLYASAVARAEADWLVGINATRALTCKYNAQLSCGRVQTPTLAIIAQREEEIKNFKPRTYYGISAEVNKLKLTWQDSKTKDTKLFDEKRCDKLIAALQGKPGKLVEVLKNKKKTYAPELYDLTELQRDANRLFGYSAKETLSIMQRLYEQYKVVTYPRTDSRYLTTDMVDTLEERVRACQIFPYTKYANKILQQGIKANQRFINNSKVSDHHAIIPTEQGAFLDSFSDQERKIFDLVVRKFLAVLYPPFEYEQTTLKVEIEKEIFTAKGKLILAPGWQDVYEQVRDEDSFELLPELEKGDQLEAIRLVKSSNQTKPPEPFTEGTLLGAMENPKRYMEGERQALINVLDKAGGLGTVATRADIIEKLFNTFLLEKRGKYIYLTSKAKQLLELVPEELKSPSLTATWEQELEGIAQGKKQKNQFIYQIKDYTKEVIAEIKNSAGQFKHDNITGTKCSQCGKRMLEVKTKKGKMLVCQDRECGFRQKLSQTTNARCPNCRKKLELYGQGPGQIFVCPCGFREKLSVFQERRKSKQDAMASKKDVVKYLHKQKGKDTLQNTALADALAKLQLSKE